MPDHLIAPHGGKLVNLLVDPERAAEVKAASRDWPSWDLTPRHLPIAVSHFPPGTSKWNKIEHKLVSFISQNWRGKPLISHAVIVKLIAATQDHDGAHGQSAPGSPHVSEGNQDQPARRW